MSSFRQQLSDILPGVGIACITGLAALFLSEHYDAPAMLFALLLGMAISFLYQQDTKCAKGIDFTACHMLRAGVALLGLRIAFSDLATLGWQTALMLFVAIITTILVGVGLAKLFKLQKRFGMLTGGSVAICGASAALAISSILPNSKNKDRDTLLAVIGVTAFSTLAMIGYPILVEYLDLDQTSAGIFLGGTIHDVAQVVGAGYSVSEESGDMAILTKLVRVAMLLPVVLVMMFIMKAAVKKAGEQVESEVPKFPAFLIWFVVLMLLNSFVDLPQLATDTANKLSRFFLVVSITAIGMKSNLGKLVEVGMIPIFMLFMETLWIALIILGYVLYM